MELVLRQCGLLTRVLCALLQHGALALEQVGRLNLTELLKRLLLKAAHMLADVRPANSEKQTNKQTSIRIFQFRVWFLSEQRPAGRMALKCTKASTFSCYCRCVSGEEEGQCAAHLISVTHRARRVLAACHTGGLQDDCAGARHHTGHAHPGSHLHSDRQGQCS